MGEIRRLLIIQQSEQVPNLLNKFLENINYIINCIHNKEFGMIEDEIERFFGIKIGVKGLFR